jgi:hypothetical protein
MANATFTDIDVGEVVIEEGGIRDETLNLSTGAVHPKGTILARNTDTLKMQLYAKGGSSNGNGVPVAILPEALDGASGDNRVRPMFTGKVNRFRLVIAADGDDSNVDATVLDLLQQVGIFAVDVTQLDKDDNPQPGGDS